LLPESTTGIRFTNHLADRSVQENQIRLMGSGVALGDVDGDGLCDIYLCQLEGPNALYRNLGNWKFGEITDQAGVACAGQYSTGAVLADLDGDGDLDLVNELMGGSAALLSSTMAKVISPKATRVWCENIAQPRWRSGTSTATARSIFMWRIIGQRRFAAPVCKC
jgi:hypothetical protein